jgi:hypothetical protein
MVERRAKDGIPKRESKRVDFKGQLDLSKAEDWCEIIKDLCAMANSGGGSILVGLKDDGTSSGWDPSNILATDPAHLVDKIAKYTGEQFSDFEIVPTKHEAAWIADIRIAGVAVPLVFVQPGTYEIAQGKQKTAFSRGTIYFRHGAKSEPANSKDLRDFLEREIGRARRSWLGNIRKVVKAPPGSTVNVLSPGAPTAVTAAAGAVRLVDDPKAPTFGMLNPDDTHPHRQTEIVVKVNEKLAERKRVTSFDIQCIRKVHQINETKPRYFHRSKFSSPQYSEAFVDWIVASFEKDPTFFDKARASYRDQ